MEQPTPIDPEAVLDDLTDWIGRLMEQVRGFSSKVQRAQLREVGRTTERLERQGHPIPGDLRRLKLDLSIHVEEGEKAVAELESLSGRLRPLLASMDAVLSTAKKKVKNKKTLGGRKKRKQFPMTSRDVLREYLLIALREKGGSAHCSEIKDRMREMLAGQFQPGDLLKRANGEIAWENNTRWERGVLVKEGILKSNSPRGVWELNRDKL